MIIPVSFNDVDFYNGYFYAASNKGNGLYRFNEEVSELVCKFNDEPEIKNLFMQTVQYGNKIIFTPSEANNIYVFDLSDNKLVKVELKLVENQNTKFHGVVVCGHYAYFLCLLYPCIVKMDIDTLEIEYMDELTRNIERALNGEKLKLTYGYLDGERMFATQKDTSIVVDINLKSNKINVRKFDDVGEIICGYYRENGIDYILSSNGVFLIENGNVILKSDQYKLRNEIYLFSSYKYRNILCFIPFMDHQRAIPIAIETNLEEGNIRIKHIIQNGECSFICVKQYDNKLYMLSSNKCALVEYDVEENVMREYLPNRLLNKMAFEDSMFKLNDWMQFLLGI